MRKSLLPPANQGIKKLKYEFEIRCLEWRKEFGNGKNKQNKAF